MRRHVSFTCSTTTDPSANFIRTSPVSTSTTSWSEYSYRPSYSTTVSLAAASPSSVLKRPWVVL